MTDQPTIPGDLIARTQTIAGLRALADFLENNPQVPVREYGVEYTYFARRDDDTAERAEVDGIARALDETIADDTANGGHYAVYKRFGRITYSAIHIPARSRAAHQALMSYSPTFHRDAA